MFAINQYGFQLTVETFAFEGSHFPSIQTEINVQQELASSTTNLLLKSVWFEWNSVEAYYLSVKQMIEISKGFAEIEDMSREVLIRFSKSETATLLTFKSEQKILSHGTTFFVSTEVDVDTINIIYRQLSELVREVKTRT